MIEHKFVVFALLAGVAGCRSHDPVLTTAESLAEGLPPTIHDMRRLYEGSSESFEDDTKWSEFCRIAVDHPEIADALFHFTVADLVGMHDKHSFGNRNVLRITLSSIRDMTDMSKGTSRRNALLLCGMCGLPSPSKLHAIDGPSSLERILTAIDQQKFRFRSTVGRYVEGEGKEELSWDDVQAITSRLP